ncbi:uncharacterized protein AC631_05398 [Debaryomyces fabryi]|uniref:SH3 domain-containing protein n=1 Tax=Debaryomyces fabryi TaxID=58627 RepID=A0A0V1PRQ8_9ASCO|nr:uncharacterized protein AC631_05398 [Debaryomyces fabryi]KRZ98849.1 hypothetical protein AC631_05398 [Debaryomyces fabryi]
MNINNPVLNMNQISSLVSKQLKVADKKFKTSTKDHFDWNNIKRTPQLLRRKANLESYTIDEDFIELENNLLYTEKKINSLTKYTLGYCSGILKVLTHSKNAGLFFQQLFDPYNTLPNSIKTKLEEIGNFDSQNESIFLSASRQAIFQEEYEIWSNCTSYVECTRTIEPSIKNEIEILGSMVEEKVSEVLKLVNFIKKHIRNRNYALMDYDKTYNTHENLLLKHKTDELSTKQSLQMYNLERKLEENKVAYTYLNDLLKKELPFFFKLVDSILQPIQLRTYYVQLLVSYQININLLSIQDIFHIDLEELKKDTDSSRIIEQFNSKNKVASDLLDLLSIINFRENFFNKLTMSEDSLPIFKQERIIKNYDPEYKYCQAIFSFRGQQEGDLSFKAGEIIKIFDSSGGWWKGSIEDEVGLFPGNYVKML